MKSVELVTQLSLNSGNALKLFAVWGWFGHEVDGEHVTSDNQNK